MTSSTLDEEADEKPFTLGTLQDEERHPRLVNNFACQQGEGGGTVWKNPHPGWSSSSRRYAQLLSLLGIVEEDLRTERYEMNEPGKTCGWTTSESSRTPSSMLPLL
ncbi:hypothetical protein ACMYSQ_001951 [Aspergillus niger]